MPVSNTRSLVLVIFILASHISDALAKHHHIKLRHGRHRRQRGDSFLPSSFVLDTDDVETGTWSPWSTPSSCSRSCGGGVAHQTRRCLDLANDVELCTGSKRRFFSCNIQECPDPTADFRAEQCATYNNQTIEGGNYEWIPYTGSANKCEFNCMPRGERFFYHFNKTLVDGTLCAAEGNDICVEGRCMPVGCDMMLGSEAKEDKCRECGGDGSACDTVQGLLDNDLQVGYNDILLIPAGATNIAISEVRPSNNYLAVRNATGHYYLNGNWRIDFPRSLRFAGTVFHYERRPRELSAADIIKALGPISEAIYIVMLYQDKNVGVEYEYSIPKRFSQRSDPDSYTWIAEEFSDCSASCGGGIRSRLVRCVRRGDNEAADDHLCDQQLEPDGTEACGEEPCAPGWVLGDWSPCNKKCGPDGEQTREIKCEQLISGGIPSIVNDYRCLELIGPKDIEIRSCNTDIACPMWHVGPWKPCDRLCGEGKERRRVTCYKKVDGKIVVLSDSECDGERPESEKDCDLRPCAAVDWVTSKWSGCDNKCGLTQETRTLKCVTLDGKVYPEKVCNPDTKPELVRECEAQEKCKFQWHASQWSECSAKCGTGIQTRKVFCGTTHPDSDCVSKVEDEKCDPMARYNDTKDCTAEFEECKGEWFAGPWSECSKSCGGGDMSRKVVCMKDNKVVSPQGNCYEEDIIFSKESCNVKACNDDYTIPNATGKPNPTEDEEECEEYEDDEFVSVDSNLLPKEFGDVSPLRPPTDMRMIEDDLMMGDDPNADGPQRGDMGIPENNSGSGYGEEAGSTTTFYETKTTPDSLEGSGSSTTWFGEDSSDSISSSTLYETETTPELQEGSGSSTTWFSEDSSDSTSSSTLDSTGGTYETGSIGSSETTNLDTTFTVTSAKSDVTDITEITSSEKSISTQTLALSTPVPGRRRPRIESEGAVPPEEQDKLFDSKSEEDMTEQSENTANSTSVPGSEPTTSDITGVMSTAELTDVSDTKGTEYTTVSAATSPDTTDISDYKTTVSPSSWETTTQSSSEETELSSLETTETPITDLTQPSASSGVKESITGETTGASDFETTVSSSSETPKDSSSGVTDSLSTGGTTSSSEPEATELASSKSTISSLEISVSSGSGASESSSTDITEEPLSSLGVTKLISGETPVISVSETTVSFSSETPKDSSSGATDSPTTGETTFSSEPEATELASSKSTVSSLETSVSSGSGVSESSSTDITEEPLSSPGVTKLITGETTEISLTETTASSSSGATIPSSSVVIDSASTDAETSQSGSGVTELSSSELTGLSSETTASSSLDITVSSPSGETTTQPGSEKTESLITDITSPSSTSGVTDMISEETTEPSGSETTASSTSGTTTLSSSAVTDSVSIDAETSSSGPEVTESSSSKSTGSSSETTSSSSTETTEVSPSGSETTTLSSSEMTGLSSSDSTESPSETTSSGKETTVLSSGSSTISPSSSETSVSTSSSISGETTGSTEIFTVTELEKISESEFTTETWETTLFSESVTTIGTGISSETTGSSITEMDEDLSTTEQSHITDIWIPKHPLRRKCKPRKIKKTCHSSRFGCCYDGIKAATGPFGKGCPIPRTCQDVEFGCCPDGVSPAIGPNYQGCPDSHCSETLFGCCKDNVTPAEGNDYEGCPIPCSETEFGCCPDGKTPAAGKDNLGCCNPTEYGCCPDGIEAASGPDGKGCKQEETSTATTLGVTTPELTTPKDTTTEISTSEASTSETSTSESNTSESTSSKVSTSSTTESITSTTTEAPENCKDSDFGCCPDDQTKATGKNFEGCGVINTENCTASYFGCCPDGASAALDPNNEGCPNACTYSMFGCCSDGSTPAHGANGEGCCLATPYGCCPDNIRHALGPKLYGCGCQYSRHGCCPDNSTIAHGPDNAGCGCQYSAHGCCPDRLTPATGLNFEGCPCTTYQFGCCPDGISIAKGQFGQGCRCENTEFKCCSDGITPAKGPNYAGCTCDASKYGCCPDGVEEAQGESYEGCLTVVTPPGAVCALESVRGSCRKFIRKWFFDTVYGGCAKFWYGGCEGNGNQFNTPEECKEVCVEPKGRDACFLPKISGSCKGYIPMWYYDAERKQCGQFVYTGCLGNNNKFKTEDECKELCVIPDDLDPCEQPKEPGPCQGNFTRWYFDKETNRCEQFNYGGCKANKNNFQNKISCEQQCFKPGRSHVQDVCVLEKDPGPCPGSLLRWYYDTERKSCREFVYGGCKGNGNKFRTYAACAQRCPFRDSCTLRREEGNCGDKLARWSFDQLEKRCMPFYYTGCGGNKNNYETIDACDKDCPRKIEPDTCLLPAVYGECQNYTRRWYYNSLDQRCREFYYGGCGGNTNNFETEYACINRCIPSAVPQVPEIEEFRTEYCFLPGEHGPCDEESDQWYYDSRYGICEPFRYGGCGGNGNKFATVEECESRCGNVQDLCVLPQVVGPCKAEIVKYYYDHQTDMCEEFLYGGCRGNQNNFEDKTSCEHRCRKSFDVRTTPVVETTTILIESDPRSPACSAPVDIGSCTEDVVAYYYNEPTGECQAFLYGGCDGNANRFETEEQCERICGKFRKQDVCNLQLDPGPCDSKYSKFYYDPVDRGCHEFLYGGCDGNANRFTTQSECESICIHREEPPVPGNRTTISSSVICQEPVSIGAGREPKYRRYYYSIERNECMPFIYSGIGGNLNRFKSLASCVQTCSQISSDVIEVPGNPCQKAQALCDTIQCAYGKEEMIDQNGCPICSCVDLCKETVCPEGEQCAIAVVAQENQTTYQSVCRLTLKPGLCPVVLNSTTCDKECSSDAECGGDSKCCINGCGSSCLEPASVPTPTTEPSYTEVLPTDYVPPRIEAVETPLIRAAEGSYVVMKCIVTGNPKPIISWRKGDTLIDGLIERYTVKADGSLQIVSIYKTDEGIYTCTAENHLSKPVRIQYVLNITAPRKCAPIILGEPNYQITVSLNAPALLPCAVSGWPRPSVQWWRGNKLIPTDDGTFEIGGDYSLRIHKVALTNLGRYTCQAYNRVRSPSSWSAIVKAFGPVANVKSGYERYTEFLVDPPRRPPEISEKLTSLTTQQTRFTPQLTERPYIPPVIPTIESPHEIPIISNRVPVKVNVSSDGVSFPEGSEFSIGCHVVGYPFPRISWFKDDAILEPSSRVRISEDYKIVINYAERNDSGRYRCEATNEYTSDSATVDIEVAGIYIHPKCQDSPFLAKCDLIVKGRYCDHRFYAKFCCRSCTKAGQLPARGPHLNETRRKKRSFLSWF